MCPQPPKKHDKNLININKKIINLLDAKTTKDICLTGGEPTLHPKDFLDTLGLINKKFPNANIVILSNGTTFKDFDFVKSIAQLGVKKITFCISVHGDTADIHNNITNRKNSFQDTVKGLYNLAKFRFNVEIRFVISKLNYFRLESFSNFIYRNFPFVVHIAFMGMEMTGYAYENREKVWIDPLNYSEQLRVAVNDLSRKRLNASIYNIPHCLVPKSLWKYTRKSISIWKNNYLDTCGNCSVRNDCCGIFTTSKIQSKNIKPLKF
jgi:His-Xaa-Ser system radical SAM maturase HxsC